MAFRVVSERFDTDLSADHAYAESTMLLIPGEAPVQALLAELSQSANRMGLEHPCDCLGDLTDR